MLTVKNKSLQTPILECEVILYYGNTQFLLSRQHEFMTIEFNIIKSVTQTVRNNQNNRWT